MGKGLSLLLQTVVPIITLLVVILGGYIMLNRYLDDKDKK